MIVMSIDPATHGCGIALWREGKLVRAGYAPNRDKDSDIVRRCASSASSAERWEAQSDLPPVDVLVVELPQVYARGAGKTKGDPNKTAIPLAMVDAAIAALFPYAEVHSYQPHAWKGSTQKPENASGEVEYIIKSRVEDRLRLDEVATVDWTKSVAHSWDVADAIGVGLHHLGRFERKRIFHRE
jgi:hypothetical protein